MSTTRTRSQRPRESGFPDKRRGRRMNSRVPVRIEWGENGGPVRSLLAHTRIVNPYGCLVVLAQGFELDQPVTLTNLATEQSNPAVIVWKGNQRPEGWEYGIELTSPEMDFWGLEW